MWDRSTVHPDAPKTTSSYEVVFRHIGNMLFLQQNYRSKVLSQRGEYNPTGYPISTRFGRTWNAHVLYGSRSVGCWGESVRLSSRYSSRRSAVCAHRSVQDLLDWWLLRCRHSCCIRWRDCWWSRHNIHLSRRLPPRRLLWWSHRHWRIPRHETWSSYVKFRR